MKIIITVRNTGAHTQGNFCTHKKKTQKSYITFKIVQFAQIVQQAFHVIVRYAGKQYMYIVMNTAHLEQDPVHLTKLFSQEYFW